MGPLHPSGPGVMAAPPFPSGDIHGGADMGMMMPQMGGGYGGGMQAAGFGAGQMGGYGAAEAMHGYPGPGMAPPG